MSKKKIIDAVQAEYPNLTKKEVGLIIDSTFNTISTQLNVKGDKYSHPSFGTWTVKTRDGRLGVNPSPVDQDSNRSFGFCRFQAATALKGKFN